MTRRWSKSSPPRWVSLAVAVGGVDDVGHLKDAFVEKWSSLFGNGGSFWVMAVVDGRLGSEGNG